jgi:hypothetical protein
MTLLWIRRAPTQPLGRVGVTPSRVEPSCDVSTFIHIQLGSESTSRQGPERRERALVQPFSLHVLIRWRASAIDHFQQLLRERQARLGSSVVVSSLIRRPPSRVISSLTVETCHRLPRRVSIPRLFSSPAIARRLWGPSAPILATTSARSCACRSAFLATSDRCCGLRAWAKFPWKRKPPRARSCLIRQACRFPRRVHPPLDRQHGPFLPLPQVPTP